jgi:hypothetical protein
MVSDICICVGKGKLPKNDLKELGLGSAVMEVLCATVPGGGCHVCNDRFLTCLKCAKYLVKNNI